MKPHKILKTFPGSHDGLTTQTFKEGDTLPLSHALASVVVPLGWAEPVDGEPEGVKTTPSDARKREIKAVTPELLEALKAKSYKDLVAAAPDYGVEATANTPKAKIIEALTAKVADAGE
jgi:hypothetical protein